jgi:hypothetical protein
VNRKGVYFYDFSDIASYGSNYKETIDGFHGSDKSYARLMLAKSKNNILKPLINAELIIKLLTQSNSSRAIIETHPYKGRLDP